MPISVSKINLPVPPFDWADDGEPGPAPVVDTVPIAALVGYAGAIGSTAGYDDIGNG